MARILVIEDNAENLELMTYLLKAFGHSTRTADDGDRGLQLARSEHPDLVVCDVHLPGTDGYGVVRQLKSDARLSHIPVIAVTALAMVGDREKGLAKGFDGYIAKPIDPEKFVSQIEVFLSIEQRGTTPRAGLAETVPQVERCRSTQATVLVVDDSPTNRELIYQTLTPFGYRVCPAHSVRAALELAARIEPDLILSDLHMPGEDGFTLIRQVKADPRLAALPFLFISSSVWGEQERETALQLGVSRFLLRPIEPQMLIDEVVACLARHREARRGNDSCR
ncbi:MAG: response regulator [Rudaea sp.]|nr:response regulator [Rudaea sp.]